MSLRRLVCFADFVGMAKLASFPYGNSFPLIALFCLLLPQPNYLLTVYLPTLFAAVLKFFLPITTSAISGAPKYNKTAPTHLAAGENYLRKNVMRFSQKRTQVHRIPFHTFDEYPCKMEPLLL